MNNIKHCNKVSNFLDQVCEQIKAKEMHSEIKLELESHLDDIIEQKLKEGVHKEETIQQAIRQMGDPMLLGKQLHQAHKPRMDWSLLSLSVIFIGIGLVAMYAIFNSQLFVEKTVHTCIGIALMVLLYFWDYRKCKHFAWHLYILTVLIIGYSMFFGVERNGSPKLSVGAMIIDFVSITPYLFTISLAGLMATKKWDSLSWIKRICIFILIPAFLIAKNHSSSFLMIYFFSFTVLLMFNKKNWKEFMRLVLPFFVLLIFVDSISFPYYKERLAAFLHPYADPLGISYMTVQSIEAIRSAGMTGQGFDTILVKLLPDTQGDMIFTYLVHSLGWMMGITIFVSVLFFVVRMIKIARQIRDYYGKLIVSGLLTIFCVQFFWNMLMSVGLLPMVGLSFPFISHGGTQLVFQLASVGMILSIYRRKDIIRDSHDHSQSTSL